MSAVLQTQTLDPAFFTDPAGTAVVWLGMAGALIRSRGIVFLVDPLITSTTREGQLIGEIGLRLKVPNPIEAAQVPRADWVMYTHADDDHIGTRTAKILADGTDCRFLAPPPVARKLVDFGVPEARISTARDYQTLQVGPVEVLVTPALHDWQEVNPFQRGDCCGYLFRTPDGTVWHPGDTRLIDELLEIHGVDVLFFDVAAVDAHLGPAGSAQVARSCGAKDLIAYHYGTFDLPAGSWANCDPDDALPYLEGMDVRFIKLNPGEPLYMKKE